MRSPAEFAALTRRSRLTWRPTPVDSHSAMYWPPPLGLCLLALSALSLEIPPDSATDPTLGGELLRLGRRRVFFGHQSVGMNLLDGVRELAERAPAAGIRVVETGPVGLAPGTLAHAFLPENGDPMLKLKNFETALAAGGPHAADVAILKFCYVDFTGHT